jgi:hypothetical protein
MYLAYPSTVEPGLTLYAKFAVPATPRRLLLSLHGWHGQVKQAHTDNVTAQEDPDWFVVAPEMRGRGDAGGRPDANGWELQDAVDAVAFARTAFPECILEPDRVALSGGSGGGGNVLGLLGKFPDAFCRARAECGISDYALWYRNDAKGEFRDELDVWVGCRPDQDPEAYASRGGLTTAANLLTPLIIFHGDSDPRVPCEQSRLYVEAARRAGRGHLVTYHEFAGVGHPGHYGGITPEQKRLLETEGPAFLKVETPPPDLPARGSFVVAGYLRTRRFEVVLESVGRLGRLEYDLTADEFRLESTRPLTAELRVRRPDGSWRTSHLESGGRRP